MTASVHRLQFVHSATSMIMFHFCMAILYLGTRRHHPRKRMTTVASTSLFRRHEMGGLERLADFLVLLHAREGIRHVLGAAVPRLDLNTCRRPSRARSEEHTSEL